MAALYTVGHGARTIEEFLKVLSDARVKVLIDVRKFPTSRRHPHFSREALARSLDEVGIAYEWWGETLGGRRKPSPESRHSAVRNDSFRAYADHMDSPEFQTSLREIETKGGDERLAVMCAETLWWRCHRRFIADALVARGNEVVHLGTGKDAPHKVTEGARLDEEGRLVYDGDKNAPGQDRLC